MIIYQDSSLIGTKFNLPIPNKEWIIRTRLYERLDTFKQLKLLFLITPAGYGKTSLLASWLSEKKKDRTATVWLTLDEEDNDLIQFWSYFFNSFYRNPMILENLYLYHIFNTSCDNSHDKFSI